MKDSYLKANIYASTTDHNSTQSTFYTQPVTYNRSAPSSAAKQLNNTRSPTNQSKSTLHASYFGSASKLQDLNQRYESQAKDVIKNYESHYKGQVNMNEMVLELQAALENEKQNSQKLRGQLDSAFQECEQERRHRMDLARENIDLRTDARRKESTITDLEMKLSVVQQTASSLNFENDGFRLEVQRLSEAYNLKIKEVEQKYILEIQEFHQATERLHSQMKEMEITHEGKIRETIRDFEARIRTLENRLREKDRVIAESYSELKSLKEFNMKVKMEFEEEVRRQIDKVKHSGDNKYEPVIKKLEVRVKQLESSEEMYKRRIEELQHELRDKEKVLQEAKVWFDEQINAFKKEAMDLRDYISHDETEIGRLVGVLRGKDSVISRLQHEIANLDNEIKRQKEVYIQENSRIYNKNEADIRKFQDYEAQLLQRIADLEVLLNESEEENTRMKFDVEKFRALVAGSVQNTISRTFDDYGV